MGGLQQRLGCVQGRHAIMDDGKYNVAFSAPEHQQRLG